MVEMVRKQEAGRPRRLGMVGPPPVDPSKEYVNLGKEDQMEIYGFKYDTKKSILTWGAITLTVGMLRLVFHWRPDWMLRCTHRRCQVAEAEKVLLKDQYHQWFVESVKHITRDGTRVQIVRDPSVQFMLTAQREAVDSQAEVALCSEGDDSLIKYFVNKKVKYTWSSLHGSYQRQKGLEEGLHCSYFHEATGLSVTEQARRRVLYGLNSIEVHVTPVLKLLHTEVLNPFYIFQVFSVILWYNDEYWYYATCILVISIVSISISVYQTRKIERALKNTISGCGVVSTCRGGDEYEDIPSDLLVPGDVIEIPRHGCIMQCDAVLISGKCIVNESMLTGESVPVTKTPVPNPQTSDHPDSVFCMKEHSRHVLFCGTNIIQARFYQRERVRAMIIRTGFATTKGELVRSIMFPKPTDFKFSQDIFKFLCVLAGIAAVGMIFTLVLMGMRGIYIGKIVLRTLDLVTIVIPPALPAAMTFGIMFAQSRLKKQRIFCISPSCINVSGSINVVCFDKTGTLTEDGLDMWGVVPVTDQEYSRFGEVEHDASLLPRGPMLVAMATCHSLTILDGQITGDPLDLKMFEATKWVLQEPGEEANRFDNFGMTTVRPKTPDIVQESSNFESQESIPYEIAIVRQFTFTSSLQRMSVIARTLSGSHFDLYAKGSPEMIASLSKPETVPADFHEVLTQYTNQGYRVIALAWRPLPKCRIITHVEKLVRQKVECDLIFLGLLVMENRLKPETTPVIRQLQDANLRTVMVTGDNMLTALSVARECGILHPDSRVIVAQAIPPSGDQPASLEWTCARDPTRHCGELNNLNQADIIKGLRRLQVEQDIGRLSLCITGKSWAVIRKHFPDVIPKLGVCGAVFARMSPDQKGQLVETLQELGYYVAMCGDGANDCGALKMAHTGISLSEAEASVASPFTSQEQNIKCVPTVIREGRAALVTSFGIIKFMATYSITQFCTVTILYWIGANITDLQFLWLDLFLLTILSIVFGYTPAYPKLAPEPPQVSLLSLTPILSMTCQLVIIVGFQVFAWILVQHQPWFEKFVPNDEDEYASDENMALFSVSSFQYITLAIICSKGAPYRKTIFSNYLFLGSIIILTACNVYLVMYPFTWLAEEFELKLPPVITFRALYVGIAAVNCLIAFIVETFIVEGPLIKRYCQEVLDARYRKNNCGYVAVQEQMQASPEWPPMSKNTSGLADFLRAELSPPETTLTTPSSDQPDVGLSDDTTLLLQQGQGDQEAMRDQRSEATTPGTPSSLNSPYLSVGTGQQFSYDHSVLVHRELVDSGRALPEIKFGQEVTKI